MNSERFVYVPNRKNGLCLFNGRAYPSEGTLKLIGRPGVKIIRQKIADVINHRKINFGNGAIQYYGLFYKQFIIDLEHRICFKVEQLLDNSNTRDRQPYSIAIQGFEYGHHDGRQTETALKRFIQDGTFMNGDAFLPIRERNYFLGEDCSLPEVTDYLKRL